MMEEEKGKNTIAKADSRRGGGGFINTREGGGGYNKREAVEVITKREGGFREMVKAVDWKA